MNVATPRAGENAIPFDHAKLDALMEAAGIDVLMATSKHNVQYLLGGYKFIFFAAMDAIGHSRYLPVLIYPRGRPEDAAYIGNRMEGGEHANHPFWTPNVMTQSWGSVDAAELALGHVRKLLKAGGKVAVEPGFLPSDSHQLLAQGLGSGALVDATHTLERLRAVKTPAELDLLRHASEGITDSMLATIAWAREGSTKAEIIERLRQEETSRGLHFEYCLITLGSSLNRASSAQAWATGEVLSIDSGGNHRGYIGDLCRMGVLGEPDAELVDLLSEVDAVQQAAFSRVRAGNTGADMIAHADATLRSLPNAKCNDFFAHGMGLISHEAPFLMTNHPVAYEGIDAEKPLEAGMVLSVETTMQHPRRGFIKLEDTLVVTADGYEMFGQRGRGWNPGGVA